MYLFPAIDLRDGRVVRLHQGDYDQQTTYELNPIQQARAFAEAGATWLHVVDLDGARDGRVKYLEVIRQIAQRTPLKIEVGGGVRKSSSIDLLFAAGVERVILGTAALQNWPWFEGLMGNPTYRGRMVLGLDARDGQLAVSGWEQQTQTTAMEVAKRVSDWPLAAIVYTDIATDGTMQGPSLDATRELAEATGVPVVASGGVGSLDHLRELRKLPIQGVIVGKAIYENAFSVHEAIATLEQGH